VNQNPKVHAINLAQEIAERSKIVVPSSTTTRKDNNEGFYSRTPRKRPLISEKPCALRLEFAKKHLNKDMEFWIIIYLLISPNIISLDTMENQKFGGSAIQPWILSILFQP